MFFQRINYLLIVAQPLIFKATGRMQPHTQGLSSAGSEDQDPGYEVGPHAAMKHGFSDCGLVDGLL